MTLILTVALAPWTAFGQGTIPDWYKDQIRGMTEIFNTYRNDTYGFEVDIPSGARAYVGSPPRPDHGLKIIIGDHRTIEVSGAFDAALYGSSEALLNAFFATEPHDSITRSNTTLCGRNAARARIAYGDQQQDVIVQWVDHSPDDAVNLQLLLSTTTPEDETTFRSVLSTFRCLKSAH